MADNVTYDVDLEFARRLNEELNGCRATRNLDQSIVILSDDDGSPLPPPKPLKERSRSPLTYNVTFDNQQAITIQRERKTRDDFFMSEMCTYISMDFNQEWKFINMSSNVQQMFDKMKNQYFIKWLSNTTYTVKWDSTNVISDNSSFKIFETENQVLVSTDALTRPRVQLVSLLFHVLIHLYLAKRSKVKINLHNEDFRKIMLWINTSISTEISTLHKFTPSGEAEDYSKQWYQCTGICSNYEPFHGTIRSTMIPDASQSFWKGHEEVCGGQFYKIFEVSSVNRETEEEEKKYVHNVRYKFPKTRQLPQKVNTKTRIQPRELYDLTDENAARVQNLCDVVDLDSSEFVNLDASLVAPEESLVVKELTKANNFAKCPFCEIIIGVTRLAQHFDKCRGFQLKVQYKH